jgi:hypothetical protein
LAYQPPASSTFLSEQTSHQPALLFSQNKPAPAISHQPTEQAVSPVFCVSDLITLVFDIAKYSNQKNAVIKIKTIYTRHPLLPLQNGICYPGH